MCGKLKLIDQKLTLKHIRSKKTVQFPQSLS